MGDLIRRILTWLLEHLPATPQPDVAPVHPPLAWGRRVSAEFRRRVREIAADLDFDPNHLMAVMAFETARTFRADVRNGAGSGATGLIQFMPATAKSMGTTVEALAKMSPEQQLEYVRLYFKPYAGKLKTLADVYMAVLWPVAVDKPDDYVLWTKDTRPTTYRQNAGLDGNKDGAITKGEAARLVETLLIEGHLPDNLWVES